MAYNRSMLHPKLESQLKELGIRAAEVPDERPWQQLLEVVSRTYAEAEGRVASPSSGPVKPGSPADGSRAAPAPRAEVPTPRREARATPREGGIDLKVKTDLELLGPKMLGAIIDKFLDNANQQQMEIQRAIALGDAERLQAAAHSLKGSSSAVGAARMAEICEELEIDARQGSLVGADEKQRRLTAELGRVRRFFSRRAAGATR